MRTSSIRRRTGSWISSTTSPKAHAAVNHPSGRYFYFANEHDHQIDVVDAKTLEVLEAIPLLDRPNKLVINERYNKLYVGIRDQAFLQVIDLGQPRGDQIAARALRDPQCLRDQGRRARDRGARQDARDERPSRRSRSSTRAPTRSPSALRSMATACARWRSNPTPTARPSVSSRRRRA